MTTHSSQLSVVFQTVMRIAAGLVLFSQASVLHALPVAGSTTAGTGKISQSADVLTVEQSSARLAIDWRSFNINSGESVIFKQPSSQSIALNRVLGQDPSTILGNLYANGQVFVLNPNGVLFGHGAQVNVGGLLASSLQLSVADFLAGRYTLSGTDHSGSVINQGTLHAQPGGYIALVAPQVVNEGVITAHLGTAALGAGQQVTLTMDAGRLLSFNVDRSAAEALVSNKQLVEADGGTVIMTARAKDALLSTVINNQGVVEARSVSVKDGTIKLDGGTSGVVASNGTLDASGTSVGERGGDIEITGGKVGLFDGAMVNASGNAGGGTVLIGGDTQGRNPEIHNAQATYVAPTAMIKADALHNGDGGKVVVWSDEMTRFAGIISARGGTNGGNGGNVETSGKVYLEAVGSVDASAAAGRAGEWLLDPYDVTLSNSASSNGSFAGGVFTPTGNSAVASITTIQTSLNGGTSVAVNTTGGGVQAGNITVANSIAKTAGGTATLTLNATNQINFAGGANLTSTTGALNVTLNAGAGGISNLQNVNTNGGALKFNSSGSATQAAGSVISGSGTLVQMGTGTLTLSGTNTYTGATTVSAGTLVATNATALGTTGGGVSVANGATLSINNVAIGAETLTLNGTGMGGNGALTGTGTASLAGNVVLGSASSIGTSSAGDTLTLSGVTSGASGVTKLGAGTLILSGNNTYTGTTTVSSGTLQLGAANRIANGSAVTVAAGATFNLNSFAETVGSIAGPGNINLGTATLTAGGDNTSTSFSGLLSGTGGFTKAGTGTTTLSGVNTYTGATTVSGGTLRLAGGSAIADVSAVTLANTAGVSLDLNGTDETIGSLAGGGATGGNVTLGTGTLTAGGNNISTTYAGVIGGAGGLTKTGTGTLTLTGANLYSGLTSVSAGTLSTTNASGLGTAAGGTTVSSGSTLSISTDILAEVLTLNGGILTKDNAATTRTWSGGVTLAAPSTISSPGGTLTLSGTVDGTGNLTKIGAATLSLSGSNSYTGQTNINAGTTQVAGGNGIGDASAVSVAAGATLNLGGANETVGSLAGAGNVVLGVGTLTAGGNDGSTTYSGIVSGTGGLTKIGAGTLLVSGNNTYAGGTTISTGTLQLGAANRIADTSALVVSAGATFNLNGFAETVGSIAGAGNVNLGAATLTAGGNNTSTTFAGVIAGTGGFFKAGSGTLALSGGNTYTGSTTVNAGTLRLAGGNAIADSSSVSLANVAGVTLDLNNSNETIGSLVGGGTTGGNVTLGTGTLTAGGNNTSTTYSGVISGTGGVTKVGTGIMTLSGANLYTGTTAISAGTLLLGTANRIADTSAVTVASTATFSLNNFAETVGSISGAGSLALGSGSLAAGADNTSTTYLGIISGTGGITKQGTGALTLSGANTYTGVTTVLAGTLVAANATALGTTAGGVSVANGATLSINNVAIGAEALTLNGTGMGGNGALTGTGAASLAGNIILGSASGIGTPTAGDTLTLSGVISGASGVTKLGAGTLVLSGNDTYTGTTAISAGTLQLGAANRIANGSAVTVAAGATFNLNSFAETVGSIAGAGNINLGTATLIAGGDNTSTTFFGALSGTGGFTKAGTGTTTLSGINTYTGATTISGGTLRLTGGGAIADASAVTLANTAGVFLDLNGADETIGSLAGGGATGGNVTLGAGTLTAGGNNTTTTYSGVISGTGGLIKAGAGVITLSGSNTYTGPTAISAGTLQLGAASRIADASAVTIAASATFSLNNFAEAVGSIAGAGNITLGSATLTAGGNNTTTNFSGVIAGSGGFIKTGTGMTILSGTNTYTGASTINAGTLRLQGGSAIADTSAVTLANAATATLDLNDSSEAIGSLAGGGATGGNVTLGTGTLTAGGNNTTTTYSGVISGTGGLIKAGAGKLTLAGANTYSGNTIISAGTLQVAGGNGIGDASSVTVATGATLSLNGTNEIVGSLAGAGTVSLGAGTLTSGGNNTSTLYSGGISGTGGLVKSGTGVLTLSGSNTHSGATTISGGTLVASNSAALGSTATGTTVANGATLQLDGLALNAETITLNGNGAGGAGALTATGNASITGPVLLATSARIGASPGVSLSLNSTVDGPGSLDIVGGGTVTFRNAVGNTGPLASLTSDATTTLVINGGLIVTSGAQTYNGLTALGGSTTLRTVGDGNILANGPVIESVGTLFLDTGAGSSTFTNASNDFATVAVTSGNAVSLVDANALAVGTSSVGALRAQTLSNDLTLTGAITASGSGDAIVLAAAGNFINTGGSLHANAGRWLVYSTDPASNTLGGVISDFKRYNCTFTAGCLTPGTTLPVTGNGLLYGLAPTLNVTADGVTTTYGASASALTYSASGFIDGDTSANALIGALARSTGAMSGSGNEAAGTYLSNQGSLASMLGYHLTFTGADYTIEPRALAVSTTAQNKIYDGTTGATVTLTDDRITGDALNAGYTSAAFLDRNAGTGKSVIVTGIGLSGADAGDYRLTSSSGTATADITAKPIVVFATSQTKVYGTPDPTLSYAVNTGGLVGSDTLTGALNRQPGETVAAGPYAITQGSLANSDYSITFNNGALVITPATLDYVADSVSIYQWTKLPAFTGTVTGFVAGDTLASATTGTLTFSPGTVGSNTAGTFASNGSGLSANSGDYVFRQAPGNATAFVILPSGETRAPGAPREAYSGGLASASRTVGSCARSAQAEGTPSGCDREGGFAGSLRAWRRAIGLRQLPIAILGSGLNLPVDATAPLSY